MAAAYPFSVFRDEFRSKRVLVTGGAKGMGRAIVRRFQLGGAAVAATARSASPEEQPSVLFIKADIGTAGGAQDVVDRIQREWGGLDILVNNVGAAEARPGEFEAPSDEERRTIHDVDLLAAVRLDLAFVPGMIERKSGIVIHLACVAHPLPFSNSTLANGALGAYSKGLSHGLAPHGVRVAMLSPGLIETSGGHGVIQDIAKGAGVSEEAARQKIMETFGGIPFDGPGRPEEVAELLAFLASDRPAFVGGADYVIDGGAMAAV